MALNTNPIYSGIGQMTWTTVLTASNASYDMTSGVSASVFVSSPSGSYLQRIRFKASGSTSGSVARIFVNRGVDTTTAANNVLFDEIALPAITATSASSTPVFEIPMNLPLPANYVIYVTLGVTQTPAGGWYASAVGGSYVPQ